MNKSYLYLRHRHHVGAGPPRRCLHRRMVRAALDKREEDFMASAVLIGSRMNPLLRDSN